MLPPVEDRLGQTEEWLGGLLKAWGVRSSVTGRWLSAAQAEMENETELVIFVQYDSLMLLFTVELWESGHRVFGIDDWLG